MISSDPELAPYEAWESGNLKLAFRLFSEQAASGDDGAQLNLGYFYDVGLGTRKNREKAMLWYLRAYRRGSSAAASNIATVYRDENRPRQAVAWYRRAIEKEDGDALVDLAKHYFSGSGVRRNKSEAVRLLKRAMSSKCITEASREEAAELLTPVQQTAARDRVRNAAREQ